MKVLPSAPVLAGTLSGFVIGIFVTLIAAGVWTHSSDPAKVVPTVGPPVSVTDQQLYEQVRKIVIRQLGPSISNQKQPRFVSLSLVPATSVLVQPEPTEGLTSYKSAYIVFRLYDHPLGRVWRMKAAKGDVFAVMKALYTSRLPIYNLQMEGRFPLTSGHVVREEKAVVAFMDHQKAGTIPWRRWTRQQEGQLWSSLTYRSVDHRFAG